MKKIQKSIHELFDEAKVYWVCPVTGVKIDSNDAAAIESHKKRVIKQEEEKALAKLQEKDLRALRKELPNITSVKDMNDWLVKLFNVKFPDLKKEQIPFVVVTNQIPKHEGVINFHKIDYSFLKFENWETKFGNTLINYGINVQNLTPKDSPEKNKEYIGFVLKRMNPFLSNVYEYQKTIMFSPSKPVGLEEKQILQKNPRYVELVKEIKSLAKQLHDIKEQHAVVNNEMSEIRQKILGEKTFDDFMSIKEEAINTTKRRYKK